MKTSPSARFAALRPIALSAILALSFAQVATAGKNTPPPTPTPTPIPTPIPTPTPTPPGPTPTPLNTARASNSDTTIDNRFVTITAQFGDGRGRQAIDVYSNALIHANARIATAQGFYTASQRGSSGFIQNPTPTPASTPSGTILRNDPPPQTAVDWGWLGNKKPKKVVN